MKTCAAVVVALAVSSGLTFEAGAQPSDTPPKLEPVPDGAPAVGPASSGAARGGTNVDEPAIRIRRQEGTEYKEYRVRGRLYAVRVTPSVGKPYWMIDRSGSGTLQRYDGPETSINVPQWTVLEW